MSTGKQVTWLLVAALLAPIQAAQAQVPSSLPLQGYLTDLSDDPIDGPVDVKFKLYDSATGPTVLFEEIVTITPEDGHFSTSIGRGAELEALFGSEANVYLGVTVGSDSEISPRSPLLTAPFAYVAAFAGDAETLGGLEPSAFASAGHEHAFAALTGIPADLLDGDQVGQSYSEGIGIQISGPTINVRDSVFQRRVSATCDGNQVMVGIQQDGTPICDIDQTGSSGVASVTGGSGLTPGTRQMGEVSLAIDQTYVQRRITPEACPAGQAISAVTSTGARTCIPVGGGTYTAGAGLTLTGTQFSINAGYTQRRITPEACPAGQAISAVTDTGARTCIPVGTTRVLDCSSTYGPIVNVPAGTRFAFDSPPCSGGKTITGGGCTTMHEGVHFLGSIPSTYSAGWRCSGQNTGTTSAVITPYMRCCEVN